MASRARPSSPASTDSATGPSKKPSQKRRRAVPSGSSPRTALRKLSAKQASRPRREGSSRSIASRSRRASTGAAPPLEMATTMGSRSTIAGMMKLEFPGPVDDIDRQARLARRRGHPVVHRIEAGGREDDGLAADIAVDEAAALQDGAGALDLRRDAGRHDGDPGARLLQQPELAQRQLTAPHDQGGTVLQIEKDRKILHRIRSIALPLARKAL